MKVIRPIRASDLELLLKLLKQASYGLTSLPKDPELLGQRIQDSVSSFLKNTRSPGGETYLFVMEDVDHGKLAGTCGIVSKVGGFEPWYTYQVMSIRRASEFLKVEKEIQALHLVADHNGPCEIGSLFLAPHYRRRGRGRLLSLSRFLFMADHRKLFDPVVIAEMRGVIGPRGHSPFWDNLGRHFFEIDFPRADHLSMVNKKVIADLMPVHPIYIPLLSRKAQSVIGQVHPKTLPALKILESEGFKTCGMVDIFEAGPVLKCQLKNIRTLRESVKARVTDIADGSLPGPDFLISNARFDFRACLTPLHHEPQKNNLAIPRDTALALQVKTGDPVRFIPLIPDKSGKRA